jgi:hypothetical protein
MRNKRASVPMFEFDCEHCGFHVVRKAYRENTEPVHKFCSIKCNRSWKSAQAPLIEETCDVCNVKYMVKTDRKYYRNKSHCCSPVCRVLYDSQHSAEMIHTSSKERCLDVIEILLLRGSLPIWRIANYGDMPVWVTIAIVESLLKKGDIAIDREASMGQPVNVYRAVKHRTEPRKIEVPPQSEEWATISNMVRYGHGEFLGISNNGSH